MLFPLDVVYARSGVELPHVETIDPDSIPLPYRSLLVYSIDMTLTPSGTLAAGLRCVRWPRD